MASNDQLMQLIENDFDETNKKFDETNKNIHTVQTSI